MIPVTNKYRIAALKFEISPALNDGDDGGESADGRRGVEERTQYSTERCTGRRHRNKRRPGRDGTSAAVPQACGRQRKTAGADGRRRRTDRGDEGKTTAKAKTAAANDLAADAVVQRQPATEAAADVTALNVSDGGGGGAGGDGGGGGSGGDGVPDQQDNRSNPPDKVGNEAKWVFILTVLTNMQPRANFQIS